MIWGGVPIETWTVNITTPRFGKRSELACLQPHTAILRLVTVAFIVSLDPTCETSRLDGSIGICTKPLPSSERGKYRVLAANEPHTSEASGRVRSIMTMCKLGEL